MEAKDKYIITTPLGRGVWPELIRETHGISCHVKDNLSLSPALARPFIPCVWSDLNRTFVHIVFSTYPCRKALGGWAKYYRI